MCEPMNPALPVTSVVKTPAPHAESHLRPTHRSRHPADIRLMHDRPTRQTYSSDRASRPAVIVQRSGNDTQFLDTDSELARVRTEA